MSGDVQPRKRKDKRRKKDDEDTGTPPPTLVNPSDQSGDNLTIHVHKEGGTGGHWCARIIFFALLALLAGLIGIILIEHRGATDVDTPVAESRWATIFDGWVDDAPPSHDEEPHTGGDDAHEEGDDHEEGDEHEEGSEEGDHEDEEGSDEAADAEAASEEDEEAKENKDSDAEEVDEGIGSEEGEEAASAEQSDDNIESENAEQKIEEQEDDDDGNDEGIDQGETDNTDDEDDALEEVENTSGEENNSAENEEDEIINTSDNELDASIEGVKKSEEQDNDDDISEEFLGIPGVNEIDDNSAEPLEEGFKSKNKSFEHNSKEDESSEVMFYDGYHSTVDERKDNENLEENKRNIDAGETKSEVSTDGSKIEQDSGSQFDVNHSTEMDPFIFNDGIQDRSMKLTSILKNSQNNKNNFRYPSGLHSDEKKSVKNVNTDSDKGNVDSDSGNPGENIGKYKMNKDLSYHVEASNFDESTEVNTNENPVTEIELLSKAQLCDKQVQCEKIETDLYVKDTIQRRPKVDNSIDVEAFEKFFRGEIEKIESTVNAHASKSEIHLSDNTAVDVKGDNLCPGSDVCDDDKNTSESEETCSDELVKVEDEEPEEVVNEAEIEPEVEEVEEESTGVAVKFGVGVALVVAAHFVLVRRWNNAEINASGVPSSGEDAPDLSRRNTIIPPPHIEQVARTIDAEHDQESDEDQAQSYEELRSKYKKLGPEDDSKDVFINKSSGLTADRSPVSGLQVEQTAVKDIWAERSPAREDVKPPLKSLARETSEEEEEEELETSEGERVSGTEEDEEEEDDDEGEDVDDTELVAKLEAKYGKLPTPPESEEDDDEEDEEDEDEDEDIQGWKRVKAPRDSLLESEDDPKTTTSTVTKTRKDTSLKGAKDHEFANISNPDDIVIEEKIDTGHNKGVEGEKGDM